MLIIIYHSITENGIIPPLSYNYKQFSYLILSAGFLGKLLIDQGKVKYWNLNIYHSGFKNERIKGNKDI